MAFLNYTNTAVDMYNLNFNALFAGETTTNAAANPPLHSVPLYFSVGGVEYQTPSHEVPVDTVVQIFGVSQTAILFGHDFEYDAQGTVTAGTINDLILTANETSSFDLLGADLSVADYLAVAATTSNADDFQLLRHLMHGNDLVLASDKDDNLVMGAGKDLFADYGGSDKVSGGQGDDWISSGNGADTLRGGTGNDILTNFATNAHLHGGAGDDTLMGGWDRDHLSGGSGADSFLFIADHGHDVITDFAQGEDRLVMLDFATGVADLTIVQQAADTRISFGHWSVLLKGVDHSTLTDADFVFGQPDFLNTGEIAFFTGWDYIA